MKKKWHLIHCMLFMSVLLAAQQRQTVSVDMKHRPVEELFEAVERQAGLKIYCKPEHSDSLYVSIQVADETPLSVLQEALKETTLKVSQYKNSIFITDGFAIKTGMPGGYFYGRSGHTPDDDAAGFSLFRGERLQKATSENKVYEIGNRTDDITGKKVTLSGTITDFKTGEPVVGATVVPARQSTAGTISDAHGYYILELPAGRHDLHIGGVGLKEVHFQVMVYSDGQLDIEMVEKVYALNEVIVSADQVNQVKTTTLGMERLKLKEIKNMPMVFGEVDVIRAVLSLPGVKSAGEIAGGFNVRGGSADQNLILFNDGTVYNPTHMFGFFSVFNPDVVSNMELYKSSIPSQYGGRISSVLDITGREGNRKEFEGSASLGLLTSHLKLEGPLFSEKTSYVLAGRTTYSDWILRQLPEKSGYKDGNAGFYDLNASLNHRFDERNQLQLSGYFSKDRFRFDEYDRYAYRNANASLKWRHLFSPKLIGSFVFGYDHYDYQTEHAEKAMNAYNLSFGIDQGYGKVDFNWYPADKHTVNWGVNGIYYYLNPGEYLPHGDESLVIPDRMQKEKALEAAIYIGDDWKITDDLSVNLGVRYSMFSALGPRTYYEYNNAFLPSPESLTDSVSAGGGAFKTYHGPEYRFSVRYTFSDDFSIKAGYNTMRQYIHKISNTTIMSPTDTWKLSDYNIAPQTGSQIAFGLYKDFTGKMIEASVECYYKTMDDYLDYRNGAEIVMNHHLETDILHTEGRAYGVELMLKKTQGKLNGWVSYTYSRTQLRQHDDRIANPVNGGNWYPADYDKPHEVKFVGNYKFTHRYSFSLNCDYSTGRPVTLPVTKYKYAGNEYVYYSDRNQFRIPDFFRTDVSFNIEPSHRLTLLTHSMISFGIYNLTGRRNAYSVYYASDNGKLKGYRLAIFGMPIPYFSYSIKF
ncbi:MAG TPA: TonB-dependent receptor [Porphyromonadaceae bacterium]|nr:TonB-dependent receptor [Porphyromonadaceae bacterium]